MMKRIKITGVKALQDGTMDDELGPTNSPVPEDDEGEEEEDDDKKEEEKEEVKADTAAAVETKEVEAHEEGDMQSDEK